MEIDDCQLTFLAEFLGENPDRLRAIGFLETIYKSPNPLVREGVIYGLTYMHDESRDHGLIGEAIDFLKKIEANDSSDSIRKIAREILEANE